MPISFEPELYYVKMTLVTSGNKVEINTVLCLMTQFRARLRPFLR